MATLSSTGRFAAGDSCADNDILYGPYATVAAAHAALLSAEQNVIGRTVGIQTGNTIEEYWYQGDTNLVNLVKKQSLDVEANPTGEATQTLTKIRIGNTIYTAPAGVGIVSIEKIDTVGNIDRYRISLSDGTYATFNVTNGTNGVNGTNAYIHIKYAENQPTQDSDMHDRFYPPTDKYIGIYSGTSSTSPTAYTSYTWAKFVGENGQNGQNGTNGADGKSALQIYNEKYGTNLDEAQFINVLKQNYPMEYVAYDQTAAGQPIGTGFSAIGAITADATTAGKMYLMPNNGTAPTGTILFATVQTGISTYAWYKLGDLNVPSNVLTEGRIVNDLTTGGAEDVLSAEQGKVLNQQSIYDVTAHNPNAGTNNDGKFASLSVLLNDANIDTLIPTAVRCGGMSIRFVQTSDNKYVQYRYMLQYENTTAGNAAFNNTDNWSLCSNDTLKENPEWLRVITDKEGRVLFGLKTDGSVEWAKGIPTIVKDYINTNIAEIWNGNEGTALDGLTKIIAFLDGLNTSPTLASLLSNKVDKQSGKSLIDETFANAQSSIPDEWLQIISDSDNKILEGITNKGIKVISLPIQMPSSQISSEYHPEWLKVITDKDGRILAGIKADGSIYLAKIELPEINYIGEPDTTVDFTVKVNCNVTLQNDNDSISDVLDAANMQDVLCTIMLPSNYSKTGKPVPLMICPHGGGGTIQDVKNSTLYKYFCANGIAVCDCNGIPLSWATSNSVGTSHCANPMAMECYNKMYQYIIENYNVEHDVILVGGSMGGMTSIQIAQLGNIPIKGIAVFCPVTDLYNQAWMHSWSNPFPADDIVRLIGLIYNFVHLDSGINDKFVWDGPKTVGFNPILSNMITMDLDGKIIPSDGCYMVMGNTYWEAVEYNSSYSFIQMNHSYSVNDFVNIQGYMYNSFKCIQNVETIESDNTTYPQFVLAKVPEGSHYWKAIKFDSSVPNIEMNHSYSKATSSTDVVVNVSGYNYHSFRCIEPVTTLESDATTLPVLATDGVMIKEYHKFPCPIKIWHCKDDPTVGYYCTKRLVNAIRNSGGSAILRPLSAGGHGPMSQGPVVNSPTGNTNFRGETLTIRGMVEEVYLWINRFVKH